MGHCGCQVVTKFKARVRVEVHLDTIYRVGPPWAGFTLYRETGEALRVNLRVSGRALEMCFFNNFKHLTTIY